MNTRISISICCCIWMMLAGTLPPTLYAEQLKAGAFAKNIDPKTLPVWVNGGIAGYQSDRVRDTLFVRCLVLESGPTKFAIAIVDNCILPHELTDAAKKLVQSQLGLPPSNVLIAATHTHSAVSVVGAHGCPVQEDYAASLPGWISEGIARANERLKPAKIGTTSVMAEKYIYCRDWLMKPGKANSTLFSGRMSDEAMMNPGYANENKLAPVGTVDRWIPILSIQDLESKPMALLASFSTHYAGATALSSDYFGVVCKQLASKLRPDDPDSFVGLMANATSGNANCIDFSKPKESFTHVDVGNYVTEQILSVLPSVTYSSTPRLDVAFDSFDVKVRMPSKEAVSEAKQWIAKNLQDRLPKTLDENYARETVLLSEMPDSRRMNVQAFRIGDFAIAANPCESYGETGLKIRQSSPFGLTMNIGLANGHCGYIAPPEMFQLGGYTTWRCRTSCLEEWAEPKMVDAIVRLLQSLSNRPEPRLNSSRKPDSPASPVSPLESLRHFELEEGFEIQLVASEPQVVDPISLQMDSQGRMWVVEMRDYPSGVDKPQSRIVILEDKDNDGFRETSTLFADNLLFATGVQPWRDGALVTVQGELLFLRDSDGDLRADKTETWLSGFSTGNPQLRANHPTLTADGWLSIASGLRGGNVTPAKGSLWSDQSVDLAGSDLRLHMIQPRLQAISGPSQFGLSFDRVGRRYGCSNRVPCFEVVAERDDINRSPLAGLTTAIHNSLPSEAESRVYPLVNAWTTSNLHAGQFTAACGVCVTHSPIFGANMTSVLTCEPTGGLVQRKTVFRNEGLAIETAYPENVKEWLASRDPWFRPVDIYEGPEGALYVVDMYRAVIEHPEWVPVELKNRPDQRLGESHGRIYRITKKGTKLGASPQLPGLNEALRQLDSSDAWLQRQASRLVLEHFASAPKAEDSHHDSIVTSIRSTLLSSLGSGNIAAVTTCTGLLASVEKLSVDEIGEMLSSQDTEIRIVALRLGKEIPPTQAISPRIRSLLVKSLRSEDAEEARTAAWLVAHWISRNSMEVDPDVQLAAIESLRRRSQDKSLWMAVTASLQRTPHRLATAFLEYYPSEIHATEMDAIERVARSDAKPNDEASSRMVAFASKQLTKKDLSDAQVVVCLSVLNGYAKASTSEEARADIVDRLMHHLKRPLSTLARTAAARILGSDLFRNSSAAEEYLLNMLQEPDSELVREVILSLAKGNSEAFDRWMIDNFATSRQSIRASIFQILRNQPRRLALLIDAMEAGKIPLRILDAAQSQALRNSNDPAAKERIRKLFESSINQNRSKVIEAFTSALKGREVGKDPSKGKAIFAKNCMSCHRLQGEGTQVGPDISDSREQTYDKLLVSILDPNRSIDANYFRYLALTEDGETVEGLLRDSNSQSVTLEGQNGVKRVLQRSELQQFKSSGASLMPEGIEAQIPPEDMAELLWYIKNWRYVAENIPAVSKLAW